MSKVYVSIGMSLDGFMAGPNRGPDNPLGDRGPTLHSWLFQQKAFRENLGLGGGGETGADNRIVEAMMARPGVSILGKRMFEEGQRNWPEESPFHTPVMVLTKEKRAAWERPGGTTFHFVNDGIESALRRARAVAGGKDIRIGGGQDLIRQYLNAGLVDELEIALVPTLLAEGLRLLDGVDRTKVALSIAGTTSSANVTHLRYDVRRV
jgi:dihydrofolate reductase